MSSELEQAKIALKAIEEERSRLIEELAKSEAKKHEYASIIKHDKELALAELEAAKSLFNKKLEESIEEKFAIESKLVLAKQDAVELALQVEKLAELAFKQATSHIIQDAQLRVSAAEISAAETARSMEEQMRKTTEGTLSAIVDQSMDAINKALYAAEQASNQARKSVAAITGDRNLMDEVQDVRAKNVGLENSISDLECQLLITKSEVDRLKSELDQALARAKASDLRATSLEKALAELQEMAKKRNFQKDELFKSLLNKMKNEAAEREKAAVKAFKSELEAIIAAVEAANETARLKDQAYMRRYAALQRSLQASEAASEVWKQRAEIAESILHGERSEEENYVINGGRIDLLTDEDSQKWKLLAEGPRREIPEWMARRIRSICPKFPPRKVDISKALSAKTLSLNLPKQDEVWSIAEEKPRESDMLVDHVIEKENIDKKRKALEHALQRKTIKLERSPEQPKLGKLCGITLQSVLYKLPCNEQKRHQC